MAQEFRIRAERLFTLIEAGKMNWIETKALLDKVAGILFQKYVNQVHEVGLDFHDPYSLDAIHPDARIYITEDMPWDMAEDDFQKLKKEGEDNYNK